MCSVRAEASVICAVLLLLAGAAFTALQLRGIVHMLPARICLASAWVFAIAVVGLSDPVATKSWKHIVVVLLATAILAGAFCLWVDRWSSRNAKAKAETAKAEFEAPPAPNIVCLGEGDLFLKLDNQNVFRDAGYGESDLRAIAPKFVNEPKIQDRGKVGSAQKVRAQVIFYEPDWPDKEYLRVDHACWLDEQSPYTTLGLDGVGYIIAGVFESAPNEDGYQKFTIYGNHPTKTGAQPLMGIPFTAVPQFQYKIKVRLIAGEHGEFSSQHDFELQAQGGGYSFGYIDEKEKALRIESNKIELKRLIEKGDKIFNSPLVNVNWDKIYSEIHAWSPEAYQFVRRLYGLAASYPVSSSAQTFKYPHKGAERHQDFFNEHYSRFVALQEIAKAQGVSFTTTGAADVEKERTRRIVADLLALSDEGKALLEQALTGYNNAMRMIMMRWEDRVYNYLEDHFDKNEAISFISDAKLVAYTLPEGSRVVQRDLIDRIHTRITRVNEIIRRIA